VKITLIEPRAPGLHVFSRTRLPRLGLPLMATILRDRGHDVNVVIESIRAAVPESLAHSDLLGISTTTSTAPRAYWIADTVKQLRRDIPVVLGGPHVSFCVDEALQHADYCVIGEGEESFAALVDRLDKGQSVAEVPGLAYRDGSGMRIGPKAPPVRLSSLPFPDLSVIDGHERMTLAPIETSRGCPHGCRFCSVIAMFGRDYRLRDIVAVADHISKLPYSNLFFYDDNFTALPGRTRSLMREMINRRIQAHWSAQVRADAVLDRGLLDLMYEAGCRILHIGFESVNDDTLKEFNKRLSVKQAVDAIRAIHERGIRIHGMFVIGSDSDDADTPKRTVDFALQHGIDTIQLLMLTPLPGTPYFASLRDQGRLISTDWQYYDGHHVVYQPARMSAYAMQYQVMKEMARFYSLRHCANLAMRFDLPNLYYRLYGWHTIKDWLADKANRAYMAFLRDSYSV
jgi:anaerobic magnesium-protoporphyrin IX monomethyl ester cyclase